MGRRLDVVPFSGIIRIRDMMYSVKDPFRLDQGDVSFDAPDTVKSAMARAIAENRTHYLQTTGVPRLLELLWEKLQHDNRIPVGAPDEIMATNGGIHGLYLVFQALLEPGDEVIVPDPEWPPAAGHVLAAGAVPVPCPLHESLSWRYDLDELGAKIGPRTKAIYLNSPSNPTGGVLTRADLEAIAEMAVANDLWVISDEAYEDVVYDGEHISIASIPGLYDRTIPVYTFSKTYAMTGLRLGYLASRIRRSASARRRCCSIRPATCRRWCNTAGSAHSKDRNSRSRCTGGSCRRVVTFSIRGSTISAQRVQRAPPFRNVLRIREDQSRLAARSVARRLGVGFAVVADDRASHHGWPCRLRAGSGFRGQRRGLYPLLLRTRSCRAPRRPRIDARAVRRDRLRTGSI